MVRVPGGRYCTQEKFANWIGNSYIAIRGCAGAILSRSGPGDQRIYSLRVTQRVRAVGFRDGLYLRLLSLHPDHDSAYS